MAADNKEERWLNMVDTYLHPRVSTWLFTIKSNPNSPSLRLILQHNSKDVKKYDQSVSLLFTPSPNNPVVVTSPFEYSLSVNLNDPADTTRVAVPFERRQRPGNHQYAESVWITDLLGKYCVPVSSRVKFQLESSNQHKGQFKLLSAHLTLHVIFVPKVNWLPLQMTEKKDTRKTDYLDNYTVFFTLRKENIFPPLWNKMIPKQSITHARSHACSTVMIDCDTTQLLPLDMGHIVGPSNPKTGPLFDLIADVTVFNRRDEIVWFHSGYLWIEEQPPSSYNCSLLASQATDEGTLIVTLQTSLNQERKEITSLTSLKVVLPTRVINSKYHQVAWDLLERAPPKLSY